MSLTTANYKLSTLLIIFGVFSIVNSEISTKSHLVSKTTTHKSSTHRRIEELEKVFLEFLTDNVVNSKEKYEILSGISIEPTDRFLEFHEIENRNATIERRFLDKIDRFSDNHLVNINMPRAIETGRFFLFKGLKKLMWPLIIGVQIVKTVLFALFLPSILGSFGKILGKGLSGSSGLSNHQEPVEDLDFKEHGYSEQDGYNANADGYAYGDESTNNLANQMYDSATNSHKESAPISRYGPGGQKVTYINSPNGYSKGTNTLMSTKKNDFKFFHEIPDSSLLLTNYDPFYSPLLSRLDSVFQQLGYGIGNEKCREKLVCLMYSNPAKYAPYSNLVSAQLSRELNQLKKPTTDNPDILRFFKYMKAAKDGQDGVTCNISFDCPTLKDSQNPVMINTYNDINKLVSARKLSK